MLGITLDSASRAAVVVAEPDVIGDMEEACELCDNAATELVDVGPGDPVTRDVSEGTLGCDCF